MKHCVVCKKELIHGGIGKGEVFRCWDCAAVPSLEDIERIWGLQFGPRVRQSLLDLKYDNGDPVFREEDS